MIDVRESTDKLKILIVDDSELNRELLAGMLEDEYEIYQVENGKKAIDILEENREQFKLVLLCRLWTAMSWFIGFVKVIITFLL